MPSGPKSNKFLNRHAEESQQRQDAKKAAAREDAQRRREDAEWEETDSKVLKKAEREREAQEKARQQAERRAENLQLLEKEENELAKKAPKKVTQRQLQKDLSKMLSEYDRDRQKSNTAGVVVEDNTPLPTGNINATKSVAAGQPSEVSASGRVGDALAALQVSTGGAIDDRHIGKRARVLYKKFYAEQLPLLKEEKPNLRRTQYNDLVWELWMKSAQNPFVQRDEERANQWLEKKREWMEAEGRDSDDDDEDSTGLSGTKK